jgi:DNA-directed RNA polymerase subunit RPC12/RpoP
MSNDFSEKTADTGNIIKCMDCGANLKYLPGTPYLNCEYCGAKNEIVSDKTAEIIEHDYEDFLNDKAHLEDKQEISTVKCTNCAASTTLKPNVTSSNCPYCDTPLVIQNASTSSIIKPSYLLPFKIDRKKSTELFISWAAGLWFAPSKIKDYAQHSAEKLNGIYVPYWTYDSNTISKYTGARGTYYYVTESYTDSQGKSQTRQVRKTSWTPAYGTVYKSFDDVLVVASKSLPEKLANDLEPWDLADLNSYNDNYLSGFVTESYQLNVKEGFAKAKIRMDSSIYSAVRTDIGGDTQDISSVTTIYNDISFKHILLPVWLSSYKFKGKVYHFLVNARTGEVQGERPYSVLKIAALVIFILVVLAISIRLAIKYC